LKFGRLIDRAGSTRRGLHRHRTFCARGKEARTVRAIFSSAAVIRGRIKSYFLFSLRQDQLARAMFPLGEKTKSDTREVARHCNLKTAEKEESMEICFVPDNNYGGFLQSAKPRAEASRRNRGFARARARHHDGIAFYTIVNAKGWASPRRSRRTSSNWTRK